MICVAFFFQILPKFHLVLHFLLTLPTHSPYSLSHHDTPLPAHSPYSLSLLTLPTHSPTIRSKLSRQLRK